MIIKGALDLKNKGVVDAMTPLKDTFMLNVDKKMNQKTIQKVVDSGHSRIPVYQDNREHIVGMLLVKNLILLDPLQETPISSLELIALQNVSASMPLYDMLNIFQQGSHMAIVVDDVDHMTPLGIVTLEAIIEELIQREIEDETDKKDKNKKIQTEEGLAVRSEDSAASDGKEKRKEIPSKPKKLAQKEKVIKGAKNLKSKIAKVLKVEAVPEEIKAPLLSSEPKQIEEEKEKKEDDNQQQDTKKEKVKLLRKSTGSEEEFYEVNLE